MERWESPSIGHRTPGEVARRIFLRNRDARRERRGVAVSNSGSRLSGSPGRVWFLSSHLQLVSLYSEKSTVPKRSALDLAVGSGGTLVLE